MDLENKDLIKLEETKAPLLLIKKSVFLVKKTEETVFVIKIQTAKAPKYATWCWKDIDSKLKNSRIVDTLPPVPFD